MVSLEHTCNYNYNNNSNPNAPTFIPSFFDALNSNSYCWWLISKNNHNCKHTSPLSLNLLQSLFPTLVKLQQLSSRWSTSNPAKLPTRRAAIWRSQDLIEQFWSINQRKNVDCKKCTRKLRPFFRGYVLEPNASLRFIRSPSSPWIPFSKFDFSELANSFIWYITSIMKNITIVITKDHITQYLTPPNLCNADKSWSLVKAVSCSSTIPYAPGAGKVPAGPTNWKSSGCLS